MDATQLKKVLEEAIDKEATPPTLTLEAGVISADLAGNLKDAFGAKSGLKVTSPEIEPDGKAVKVSGKAALLDMPDTKVTITLTPEDDAMAGAVTANLESGSKVTVPGFDWLTWSTFDLNAAFPLNGTPASGTIDARLGPLGVGLDGALEVRPASQESSAGFHWTLTLRKADLGDLTLERFWSVDTYISFLDLLIEQVSDLAGLKVTEAELGMDPGISSCMILTTEFDWEMLSGVHVRNLGLCVTSLSGQNGFPLSPRAGLQGQIQMGSLKSLAFDAGLARAAKGLRFDFDLKTVDGTPLTIGDLSSPFLDIPVEDLPVPGDLGTRIKNSGFSELMVEMAPKDQEFAFLARGDLLGLTGSVWFRVQPVDQKPKVRLTLLCTNDPVPLATILQETLLIPVDPSVEAYLAQKRIGPPGTHL